MAFNMISLICSFALTIYYGLAVAQESFLEVWPKRIIVAGITAGVGIFEIVTSSISFIVCYAAIGCCRTEGDQHKESKKHNKVVPQENGVTIVTLSSQQASEFLLNMHRKGENGHQKKSNVEYVLDLNTKASDHNNQAESSQRHKTRQSKRRSKRKRKISSRHQQRRFSNPPAAGYDSTTESDDEYAYKNHQRTRRSRQNTTEVMQSPNVTPPPASDTH